MLYQTGTERIEIVIRKEVSGGSQSKAIDELEVGENGEVDESGSVSQGRRRSRKFWRTNITHSIATAHQILDLSINYALGQIGNRYGDQALQDTIQRDVEVFQDVTNIATATAMGLAYGSAGGVAGSLIGGFLGMAGSVSSTVVKYSKRQKDYDYNIFKENNSISYQRARTNISLTTGRLR